MIPHNNMKMQFTPGRNVLCGLLMSSQHIIEVFSDHRNSANGKAAVVTIHVIVEDQWGHGSETQYIV